MNALTGAMYSNFRIANGGVISKSSPRAISNIIAIANFPPVTFLLNWLFRAIFLLVHTCNECRDEAMVSQMALF